MRVGVVVWAASVLLCGCSPPPARVAAPRPEPSDVVVQPSPTTRAPRLLARKPAQQSTWSEYQKPSDDITRFLSADNPPTPLVHTKSRSLAFIHRERFIPLARLSSASLGLAGTRINPHNRTIHGQALIERIEVISLDHPKQKLTLEPPEGALLEHPQFSASGAHLAAVVIWPDTAQLVVYDLRNKDEVVVEAPLNLAWGAPCSWLDDARLLCRNVEDAGEAPARKYGPSAIEHLRGSAPARTLPNLLQNNDDEALFEHYFNSGLVVVSSDGTTEPSGIEAGLFSSFQAAPDDRHVVVTHLQRPYSRMVAADRFARRIRVFDLETGSATLELQLPHNGAWPTQGVPQGPRSVTWSAHGPATLSWVEKLGAGDTAKERIVTSSAPFANPVAVLAETTLQIQKYGFTTKGRLYFMGADSQGIGQSFVRMDDGTLRNVWQGGQGEWRPDPGSMLRVDGDGSVLEHDGQLFFNNALSRPPAERRGFYQQRLDGSNLRAWFHPPARTHEVVLAVLDANARETLVARESMHSPPNYYLRSPKRTRKLTSFETAYPELEKATRRSLTFRRKDGVNMDTTIYLPPGRREGERLPAMYWIYPAEYSNRASTSEPEAHRYWSVSGPSRFCVLLAGYALIDQPSLPIVGSSGSENDRYLEQLIESASTTIARVSELGLIDETRIAVSGRSYGAFSAANLLVHTELFRTAVAMNGAYNRTLTPFGFQRERRSFWQQTELYTKISPFFHAHRFTRPLLLVHGADDPNPGTSPLQSERFFHALAGNGAPVRYVSMPFEGHQYQARESVLHVSAELMNWLARHLGPLPADDGPAAP